LNITKPIYPLKEARGLGVCRLCGHEITEDEQADPEQSYVSSTEYAHNRCFTAYWNHIKRTISIHPFMWRREA
jgi:predicted amidophosphoribosyltransferase